MAVNIPATDKARTKTQVATILSEITEVPKKDVSQVIDALGMLIQMDLGENGPQQFTLPGVCKFNTKIRPATEARPGRNPFTGEEIMIAAKPERKVVKIRPLKNLKDAVE